MRKLNKLKMIDFLFLIKIHNILRISLQKKMRISKRKPNLQTNVKLKEALCNIKEENSEKKMFEFNFEKELICFKIYEASQKERIKIFKKEDNVIKKNILKTFNDITKKKMKNL